MTTEDGSLVITFNGEIYNFKNLRVELERKGYRFHSQSDTEVLLHLYTEKGLDMLNDLRGMFAFAIWHNKKKGLFIARDPFGIKPLYYADDGKTFNAASQVKALLKATHMDTRPEAAGHVGFFLWGHVPEPYTFYRGIRSLPDEIVVTVIKRFEVPANDKGLSLEWHNQAGDSPSQVMGSAEMLDRLQ